MTEDHRWPPADDIASGDAGGGGIGSGASGKLPIGFTETIGTGGTVFVGGANVVFGPHADWGDPSPSDVDFEAQPIAVPGNRHPERPAASHSDFSVRYSKDSPPWVPDAPPTDLTNDLAATKFVDSTQGTTPGKYGYLRSLFTLGRDKDVVLDLDHAKMQLKDSGDPVRVFDVLRLRTATGRRKARQYRHREHAEGCALRLQVRHGWSEVWCRDRVPEVLTFSRVEGQQMAEKWIQGAIKHPGALTKKAKAAGESLSQYMREAHKDPTTRRQVALARTLKAMHSRRKGK